MQQKAIYNYAKHFFLAKDCQVKENHEDHSLSVELTPELDEKLMNRVFYWYYMKKIGGNPEPMTLTLEEKDLYFGSPRVHQLFNLATEEGRFIRFYEAPSWTPLTNEPLFPWLLMNVKITYKCDLSYDRMVSLGVQLLNGMTVTGFNEAILTRDMQTTIPDLCYTMMPLISPASAIIRLEHYIYQQLSNESFEWANQARERWQRDLELLDQFGQDGHTSEDLENEKKALQDLYEPKITIHTCQAGLVYLTQSFVQDVSS